MSITLTLEQAEQIKTDYEHLVGQKRLLMNREVVIDSITVEPAKDNGYTVILDVRDGFGAPVVFNDPIDAMLEAMGEDFDITKYTT